MQWMTDVLRWPPAYSGVSCLHLLLEQLMDSKCILCEWLIDSRETSGSWSAFPYYPRRSIAYGICVQEWHCRKLIYTSAVTIGFLAANVYVFTCTLFFNVVGTILLYLSEFATAITPQLNSGLKWCNKIDKWPLWHKCMITQSHCYKLQLLKLWLAFFSAERIY